MDDFNDTLTQFGSEIKTVEETATGWRVGGWLVVFDNHDISRQRDMFTKATDYDFRDGDFRSLYYHHGCNPAIKRAKIGTAQLFHEDAGIWYEGEIKRRQDYLAQHVERIVEGAKNGIFGASSGAVSHLVERKAVAGGHEVTLWPIGEVSITPTPAEPLTTCNLKALVERENARLGLRGEGWDSGRIAWEVQKTLMDSAL